MALTAGDGVSIDVASEPLAGLDDVERALRLTGYVASNPGFTDQPIVIAAGNDALFEKLEGEVLEGGETLQAMLDRVELIEGGFAH